MRQNLRLLNSSLFTSAVSKGFGAETSAHFALTMRTVRLVTPVCLIFSKRSKSLHP